MFASLEAKLISAAISGGILLMLVAGLLYFRGNAIKAQASAKIYQANAKQATDANAAFAKSFADLAKREADNAKLIENLNLTVQGIDVKTDTFKTDLKKVAANDANVKAFIDQKLPASVLAIVNANGVQHNAQNAANPH